MKFFMVAVVGSGLLAAAALADEKAETKSAGSELKDVRQKASYGYGLLSGKQIKGQGVDLDLDMFVQGLKDAFSGAPSRLTDDQIKDAVLTFQKEQVESAGKQAKAEGDTFLAENKKKPNVVTLPSGVQYKVIKDGTGKTPRATDTVTVDYEGRFINGTVFDSSAKHPEQPSSFPVNGVIPGFSEALQLMKVGSRWEIYIPFDRAYGAAGRPGIPGYSTLIFNVEMKSIQPGPG
jgi:FKBP-type peptidyl-prolyl cis-trans isomerase FklB